HFAYNAPSPTPHSTLSLHDALPISRSPRRSWPTTSPASDAAGCSRSSLPPSPSARRSDTSSVGWSITTLGGARRSSSPVCRDWCSPRWRCGCTIRRAAPRTPLEESPPAPTPFHWAVPPAPPMPRWFATVPTSSRSWATPPTRSEEHTSELQSRFDLVCRLLLEKKKTKHNLKI